MGNALLERISFINYRLWPVLGALLVCCGCDRVKFGAPAARPSQPVVSSNCVLWLSFNAPATNGLFLDRSRYGHHAVNAGRTMARVVTDPERGNVLELDGVDSYLTIPRNSLLDLRTNLTVSVWLKPIVYERQMCLMAWHDGRKGGVHLCLNVYGGQWGGQPAGAHLVDTVTLGVSSAGVVSVANPPLGQWHHMVVTFDAAAQEGRLYFNGKPAVIKGMSGARETSGNIFIGWAPFFGSGDGKFHGFIDELQVFRTVWNEAEVAAEYRRQPVHGNVVTFFPPPAKPAPAPPPAPAPTPAPTPKTYYVPDSFVLKGIMLGGERPTAIIQASKQLFNVTEGGSFVVSGGSDFSYRCVEITRSSVTLSNESGGPARRLTL